MCASDGSSTRREDDPSTGNRTTPSRFDQRDECHERRSADLRRIDHHSHDRQGDLSHYPARAVGRRSPMEDGRAVRPGRAPRPSVIPTGVRFVDNGGQPFQAISRAPSHEGGVSLTASGVRERHHHDGERLTINAGLRFDHSRAISPGPARARSRRARNRRDRPAAWERCTPGTCSRHAWASRRNSPPTAERCCAQATGGSARAC